ncbi:putative hydrolase [Porphyridium purpureum]|uniref:Putative hydrolase n=1 Tax=Porphyridium purpureum TaxID=35688 RepID=A0A5J4Z7C7_PORPP|nr:putative hydrolase [Porphyridium purpureum]|eukprot:POR3840..scf295_1
MTSNDALLVCGSGVSTGIPRLSCVLTNASGYAGHYGMYQFCKVCDHALNVPGSRNKRGNVQIAVRHDGRIVLVDAGKTMRESLLAHFPAAKFTHIDAVLLTHGHADAFMGMDDLRDLQMPYKTGPGDAAVKQQSVLPVYCNKPTYETVREAFPYLTETPSPEEASVRRVAMLDFRIIQDKQSFEPVERFRIQSIPLWHGNQYVSLGYIFYALGRLKNAKICHLSDVSEVSPDTLDFLLEESAAAPFDVLLVDCLLKKDWYSTHFGLPDALELVRRLRPKRTLLIGMTCRGFGLHDKMNKELHQLQETEGLRVELAYDGLLCEF